jgi:holo-[acyl-carrier protein] synthase
MPFQVGVDLVCGEEVERALAAHGDRYLERVYTEDERTQAGGRPLALAARFAAKEAAMKALRSDGQAVNWQSIEVITGDHEQPSLRLSGAAADNAQRARITRLGLSISYRKRE